MGFRVGVEVEAPSPNFKYSPSENSAIAHIILGKILPFRVAEKRFRGFLPPSGMRARFIFQTGRAHAEK
jgi:hypothetical protein